MRQSDYYAVARTEILPWLPPRAHKILDVGCGAGATGKILKEKFGAEVHGLELMPEAAEIARTVLDSVTSVDLNSKLDLPHARGSFDLILCLDVLEHLVDPWRALREISAYLAPGGTILVSVPNVRHFRTSLPLLFAGRFDYEESGVRDSTHLRFFTRRSAEALVRGAGLEVTAVNHTGRPVGSKTWALNLISLGLCRELFDFQYVISARSPRLPAASV